MTEKLWVLADGITREKLGFYDTKEEIDHAAYEFLCDEGYGAYVTQEDVELFTCPVCGLELTATELDDDGMCNTCADTAREASVG